MADTDGARIGDVKAGFVAAKDDANRRLKRDGSNVDMTPDQAAAFRAAIGAGSGGGSGGGGDVVGPASSTQNALAQFADSTGKLLKGGPLVGVSSPGSLPTRADADDRYQAKAAALTALAGLNAPGLYYLSDVDAWSPVTIGAGLDFASGTLTATGGGGGGGSGDVTGPATATADSLVLFSGTTGKVIKGGPALGVGSAGSVPTRADADGRYQSKLGFTPADAADLETKADLVGGKVPAGQLATATVAQVRAGKVSGVVIEPDEAAGAMAFTPLTDAATVAIDLDTGPNFTLTTTAGVGVGRIIGAPTNGNVGQYYTIRITAHAGATVAWNTAFKWPGGKVEAIANTAGAITEVAFKMVSGTRFDVVGFVKDIR